MRDELERGKVLRLAVKVVKGKYIITLWNLDSWVKGQPSIADQTGDTAEDAVRKIAPYIAREIGGIDANFMGSFHVVDEDFGVEIPREKASHSPLSESLRINDTEEN